MIPTNTPHATQSSLPDLDLPAPATPANGQFDWPLANKAEDLLRRRLETFLQANRTARRLADRMRDETATDFFEWIDHFILSAEDESELGETGFVRDQHCRAGASELVYEHPRATLPRVILVARPNPLVIALRPESIVDFCTRQNIANPIEGEPFSRYRRVKMVETATTRLEAIERRAYRGFVPAPLEPGKLKALVQVNELWRRRPRYFIDAEAGFRAANGLLDQALALVGPDHTCQMFFETERVYWESRNLAARIQKHRQDQLGLGWGNHDHHTFRCSRDHFVNLIEFLKRLGFVKRERFYAGAEAGWGAQVLEQSVAGIVVFADVDLLPEETHIDFSARMLPPASRLGTVGLWVGLHGESFLEAGMHHLEARFDFDLLREQLKSGGINTMEPFSDFDFLKQAFTEGERWPAHQERVDRLLASRLITQAQAEQFIRGGALGSHLENLQRHGGFKGFNQKSVSAVIAATDPRKTHFVAQMASA